MNLVGSLLSHFQKTEKSQYQFEVRNICVRATVTVNFGSVLILHWCLHLSMFSQIHNFRTNVLKIECFSLQT